jgi:hypothetical protein
MEVADAIEVPRQRRMRNSRAPCAGHMRIEEDSRLTGLKHEDQEDRE